MVQLTEVEDEHFQHAKADDFEDDEDFSDTGTPPPPGPLPPPRPRLTPLPPGPLDSEISTDSNYDPLAESLSDRLAALRDIVPPTTRAWVGDKVDACTSAVKATLLFAGRAAWAVSVSALLVGVPFALAYGEDQNLMAMEQEERMRAVGSEMLTAGGAGGEGGTKEVVGAMLGEGQEGGVKEAL